MALPADGYLLVNLRPSRAAAADGPLQYYLQSSLASWGNGITDSTPIHLDVSMNLKYLRMGQVTLLPPWSW